MLPDKQHLRLFFDLDNTLTYTHEKIEPRMKALLEELKHDKVVIASHTAQDIEAQLDGLDCYILGQQGNDACKGDTILWQDVLTKEDRVEILAHIASLPTEALAPDPHDLIDDRGCSVSYSLYGHHAPLADKLAFDPDQAKRIRLLAQHPLDSERIDVKLGDSTTLEYFLKRHTKGFNIARLCQYMSWNLDTCIYFGDALFPGGTDETVIGIIDTQSVRDPEDMYEQLTRLH